jgi:acyl-coenzyme A thioesterase PaaI-like protein
VGSSDASARSSGGNRPRGVLPTSPPPDAVVPRRSPNAPPPGSPIPSHYRWCFGCGSEHPTGLHLAITAGEGLTVTGSFTVSEHLQGAPGLAHGGLLTTALDEMLGSLNWLLEGPAVTGRLECDFRKPVPVGTVLHIDAEVVGVKGRKVFTRAVGRLDSADGPVAVTAAALFVQVPLQHFVDHGSREQVQQAIDDRREGGPAWRPVGEEHTVEVNP